jgi:SAM-dependent methyltransferase
MDEKELRKIAEESKLNSIYKNSLFSIKSICQHLNTWDSYSDEEKFKLENLTIRDSQLSKNYKYIKTNKYQKNFVYGEITRKGVDELIQSIYRHKKTITDKDVFVDIGSGTGKLILHTAISSTFKTLVGVEVIKERYQYAKSILETASPIDDKKVFFINKDIRDFDLSFATVVFINNLCFDSELNKIIYDKLPTGCHFISALPYKNCIYLKDKLKLGVSWIKDPFVFNYYIK